MAIFDVIFTSICHTLSKYDNEKTVAHEKKKLHAIFITILNTGVSLGNSLDGCNTLYKLLVILIKGHKLSFKHCFDKNQLVQSDIFQN